MNPYSSSYSSRASNSSKRGREQSNISVLDVGAIGYTFRNFFPGYGTFDGVVVSIQDQAGRKFRRCVYTDGDEEDIELSHLRTLPKSKLTMEEIIGKSIPQSSITSKEASKEYTNGNNQKRIKTNNNSNRNSTSTKKKARRASKRPTRDQKLFTPLGETVPIDEVAEATLLRETLSLTSSQMKSTGELYSDENESNGEDLWLENVASILANGGKTRSSNSRSRKIINKVTKKGAASSVASNGTDSCTASTKSKDTRLVGNETQPKSESPLNDSSNDNPSSTSSKPLQDESHVVLLKTMREFFSKNRDPPLNCRQWKILSIEDAILCQEKSPFPLGMLVRRFFPRYGFHDGCITFVQRKLLFEEQKGTPRPVLVYRVKYQGGDEEDFMHHEVNSLRQIYDVRNVLETAPPSSQLPTNMVLECQNETTVKIIKNMTPPGTKNPKEGGRVQEYVSKNGSSWAKTELDLTELQLIVIRKYEVGESLNGSMSRKLDLTHPEHSEVSSPSHSGYTLLAPTIEWPSGVSFRSDSEVPEENECNIENSKNQLSPLDEKKEWKLSSGLYLVRETSNFGTKIRSTSIDMDDQPDVLLLNNQPCVRKNISRVSIWDPTHISNYLSLDPYRSVVCEICKVDENDHQILICDRCHQGYHMYCLRPIIVTVPTNEWLCSKCSPESSSRQPFQEIIKSLQQTPHQMTKFLFLPFCNPKEFFVKHEKELELFGPNCNVSKRQSIIGNLRSRSTVKIGSLSFSCNPQKNDWLLPLPLPSLNLYESSLASMVAAMRHCGMDSYTEDLVYAGDGVSEAMNNASLDKVQPMSRRNIEIFKEFKENLKNGAFPPIKIVFDSEIGFTVEALTYIPRHTLIAEYVGEVTTLERSGETSSDSLMILLDTEDPQTSLIIDPTRTGNAARFLSGINNLSNMSKRKANVRTRRFELDGKCRVALFTAKKVEAGDQLYYDYNAGMIGKDVVDWAKNGFYDTRNFF